MANSKSTLKAKQKSALIKKEWSKKLEEKDREIYYELERRDRERFRMNISNDEINPPALSTGV